MSEYHLFPVAFASLLNKTVADFRVPRLSTMREAVDPYDWKIHIHLASCFEWYENPFHPSHCTKTEVYCCRLDG
jgi:hypothetical protein